MSKSRIPRNFGFAGVAIGLMWMMFYLSADRFNFFHNPTAEQAQHMPSYKEPRLEQITDSLSLWSVPAMWITALMGGGGGLAHDVVIWTVASAINFPLYYVLGLGALGVLHRRKKAGRVAQSLT